MLSHGYGTYLKPPLMRQPTPLRALHGSRSGTPLGISTGLRLELPPTQVVLPAPTHQFAGARLVKSTLSGVSKGLMSTRLALQLFLVKGFKLYSFQLQDPKEPCISIYCHYLPVSGLGNLRACCLPWMW